MKTHNLQPATPAKSDIHADSDAYLHVHQLTKSYDGITRAVDHVDLHIRQGEFVTFLGPSGSGKTTTLSMIAGFETPTSGDIFLNQRSITGMPANKRNIGLVFQNYALFPHMTVLDNVGFPLRMRKVPAADIVRRARQALAIVSLDQHAGRFPRQLSGGQQQRVALARALVFEPDVLLLDEPLSALDKNLREHMQVEIKRLHREFGMTTVFVTHDQSEAMTMSDRIAVFNHGIIEQFGTPLEVYARPSTHFVGSFIGDSNFIEVTALDAAAGIYQSSTLGAVHGPASTYASGTALWLMLRPEVIRMGAETTASSSDKRNLMVDNVMNFGDSLLLVGHAGAQQLRVRVPRIDAGNIAEGKQFSFSWMPDDSHVQVRN